MCSLRETLEKKDIIITLPSNIEWSDYEKELDAVKDESQIMNFKVPFLPSSNQIKYIFAIEAIL